MRVSFQAQKTAFPQLLKYNFSFNYPCPRKLREVMKMSLIEKEP